MPKLKSEAIAASLLEAFASESASHWRYLRFAEQAEAEGIPWMARRFRELARVQLEAAERLAAFLDIDQVTEGLAASAESGLWQQPVGGALENLRSAIECETFDATERYPSLAEAARQGAEEVAASVLEELAVSERAGAERLGIALGSLERSESPVHSGDASEPDALAQASELAASHPGLAGQRTTIEALLRLVASQAERIGQRSAGPQQVVRFDELVESARREAEWIGEVRQRIWQERMLKPLELAKALRARNRERIRALRARSELLAVPHQNSFLYPAFQIDLERRCIHDEAAAVNRLLRAAEEPWATAAWWVSPNGWLEARPCDLLGTERAEEVVEAARAVGEHIEATPKGNAEPAMSAPEATS